MSHPFKRLRLFLIAACCICQLSVLANETDSLKALLVKERTDSLRVDLLNALSKVYFNINPDSALYFAVSSKGLSERIDYLPGLALANKNIGRAYYLQGKYKEAVLSWQAAMAVYEQVGDKKGVANMYSNQGAVYFAQGDDAKALELHLQSLKISEQINDSLRVLTSLINIGGVYSNKESTYKKALEYFHRAFKLSQQVNDKNTFGAAAVNLGEVYYKLGDDSTALQYLMQSKAAYEGTEDLPYTLNGIGKIYTHQQKFVQAIQIHREAFELAKSLDIKLDQTQSLVGMAQAYYQSNDFDNAIAAFKQSIDLAMPLNAIAELKDAYQGLSEAYAKKSDFGNAYKYQHLLLAIKDTIYNENTDKKLGTLQFTFDLEKKETQINLLNKDNELKQQEIKRQKLVKYGFIVGFAIVLLSASIFLKQRNRISKEKKRSEELLLNILPEETAEELKATGQAKTKSLNQVSVLFTDFKNFTIASEHLTPEELVSEINHCYSEFDRIITKHGIEKIKTIGDSYMCAGGLPVANTTHAYDAVSAALEMVQFIEQNKQERIAKGQPYFELRLGIHTGPVVAGIVGIKKFAYDIWGDTVNTASRMESSGEVGKVNISGTTYELIKDRFQCTHRGKVQAKNKGLIDMYFVEGKLS